MKENFQTQNKKSCRFLIFISIGKCSNCNSNLERKRRGESYEHCFDMELEESYILQTMVVCLDDMF